MNSVYKHCLNNLGKCVPKSSLVGLCDLHLNFVILGNFAFNNICIHIF